MVWHYVYKVDTSLIWQVELDSTKKSEELEVLFNTKCDELCRKSHIYKYDMVSL